MAKKDKVFKKLGGYRPVVLINVHTEQEAFQAYHCIRVFFDKKPDDFKNKKLGMKHGAEIKFEKSDLKYLVYQTKAYIKVIRK